AGDAVDAVCQENRVIVHRRQAASHGPVFAARQRYVEDVVAPPTKTAFVQQVKWCSIKTSLDLSPAALSMVRQATTTPTA
ncbi:hypothetical protein, partial [Pseudomonas viridiflava]|uniref:hypothetical protein n=1 Tax=Pseudomonas viridiflava TaxID=33069 RepID=UPI00197DAD6C